MRKNLSVSDWLNQKFGDDIPEKCLDAFEDDSLILLPLSFRNSYIKELKFPIPLFLPDTKIAEIASEYQDLAEEEIERKQINLELGMDLRIFDHISTTFVLIFVKLCFTYPVIAISL